MWENEPQYSTVLSQIFSKTPVIHAPKSGRKLELKNMRVPHHATRDRIGRFSCELGGFLPAVIFTAMSSPDALDPTLDDKKRDEVVDEDEKPSELQTVLPVKPPNELVNARLAEKPYPFAFFVLLSIAILASGFIMSSVFVFIFVALRTGKIINFSPLAEVGHYHLFSLLLTSSTENDMLKNEYISTHLPSEEDADLSMYLLPNQSIRRHPDRSP